MIIKLEKIISCSSQHPTYPASNLLQRGSNSSWRCAKPGEMLATVIFQLFEPSCITGLDIGNYRSCVVIVAASTTVEPDNWIPIANHQFLTNDEAANGKFRDQVQIFTKKELNPDTLKQKFDRVKVTCMQSANLKELFGLSFVVFKTEVVVDLGLDVFGRFKMKQPEENEAIPKINDFKNKFFKTLIEKKQDYKTELLAKVKETTSTNFVKRQEEDRPSPKRPQLKKLENGKTDLVETEPQSEKPKIASTEQSVKRTPFGDVIPSPKAKKIDTKKENQNQRGVDTWRKRSSSPGEGTSAARRELVDKLGRDSNEPFSPAVKPTDNSERGTKKQKTEARSQRAKKPFEKLFEGITFSLSGYQNPKRDEIRRKALDMGAKYIADPNTTNKKCTHLICAFKNTPKYNQLKGHSKIVLHTFIEECFNEKTRFPWRRYALDNKDKNEPESEEEISSSPQTTPNPFLEDTDSDSNY